MGILHIEDGRVRSWWFKLAALSIAVGAGLGWVMVGSAGPSAARPVQAALEGCCSDKLERVGEAGGQHDMPQAAPVRATRFDAALAYRTARSYADCVALNERDVEGVLSELEESRLVDPSGEMAAPLYEAEKRLRAHCQRIGPAEYAQIDPLMREAAAHGDLDARYYLLDRRLRTLIERAAADRSPVADADDVTADGPSPPATAREAVAEAEALAKRGHPAAMDLLGSDLLLSGLIAPADPIRAAAWRLVMSTLQQGGPLTVDDVIKNGQLVALSSDEAERVVREAQALREACCGARAP